MVAGTAALFYDLELDGSFARNRDAGPNFLTGTDERYRSFAGIGIFSVFRLVLISVCRHMVIKFHHDRGLDRRAGPFERTIRFRTHQVDCVGRIAQIAVELSDLERYIL